MKQANIYHSILFDFTKRGIFAKIIRKTMATIVLQVPDEKLVTKVKTACKMLVGVTSVKVQKNNTPKEFDITKTTGFKEALKDVKHGRVTKYESLEDFYKEMGL